MKVIYSSMNDEMWNIAEESNIKMGGGVVMRVKSSNIIFKPAVCLD